MREILFKAKRIDNGEWVEGFLFWQYYDGVKVCCIGIDPISVNDYSEIISCWFIVDEKTVCEYTGLKDYKGNKIFEHDILMNERTEKAEELFYGEFNCSCCNSVYGYYTNDCVDLRYLEYDNNYIVVCGNKFDYTQN